MAEHGALEKRIVTWLQSDGFKIQKQPLTNEIDFNLTIIDAFGLGINIGIVKLKRLDRIRITTNMIQDDDMQNTFKKINQTVLDQQKIIQGLHRELLKFGVDHTIKSDLSEILFFKDNYIDNMTRTKLMDTMKEVRNVVLYVRSVFFEKFGNISESKPSTEYGMYS